MRNIRLAFRVLFKSPFTTSVAVLSLALGIGANAAIYSLFDQILLRPLPVRDAGSLVNLGSPGPKQGSVSCNQAGDCEQVFSYPMFRDLQQADARFSGLAGHRLFEANVAIQGQTLNTEGLYVSGSYFPLLGIRPGRGRLLGPDDDATVGAHSVAVISDAFWQNRLGADPDIVGQTIVVNGQPLTIAGVAPAGFEGTTLGSRPTVYVPLGMRGVLEPGFAGFDNRRNYWIYAFARLQPGAGMEEAEAAINAAYRPIINDVEAPLQTGLTDQRMAEFRQKQIVLADGRRGQSSVHTEASTPLLLMFATAAIVLLIACANIANLLLARGAQRGMEMAVRLSLGAHRRQVLTQLLTESVVLGLLGGAVSLLFAQWTLAGIGATMPPEVADAFHLQVDTRVMVFAGVLALATGIVFGFFPALHSTRADLISSIRSGADHLTGSRTATRFRSSLVTAQIALSMTLLVTAGLFLRSLDNISRVELGLATENVVTFGVSPQLNGYDPERAKQFFERMEQELAAIPGVSHVSAAMVPVLAGSNWTNDVSVEGFERGPGIDANASFNMIGPGYFDALHIPVRRGREFSESDNAVGMKVAIVNEAFVRKFNLGGDAVGRRMGTGDALDMEIIGVVADAKYNQVKGEMPPLYFTPWRQSPRVGALTFYVRTSVDPGTVMRAIPPVVAGVDPHLPVERLKTLPQQVRENVFIDRMIGTLSASFAALATLLAAVGLYGVLAYTVALRTREIGVRMALGADRGAVRTMILRQVALMLVIGGVVGLGAALALGRVATSLLFGVAGADPLVMGGAVFVLAGFAFAAGYVPAARAAGLDPVKALRWE